MLTRNRAIGAEVFLKGERMAVVAAAVAVADGMFGKRTCCFEERIRKLMIGIWTSVLS